MGKVLVLASIAPMIEAFNQKHIQTLQAMGHEVHVAANFTADSSTVQERNQLFKAKLTKQGILVFDLPIDRNPFSIKNFTAYLSIRHLFDQQHYDMVHCHSPIGGVLTRLATSFNQSRPFIIYTAHGFHFFKDSPLKNWLLYYPIEKVLSKRTDCLITINKEDYTFVQRKNFSMKSINLVSGVGINLNKFLPTSDEKRKVLRKQYGYNENDFLLIYVGELIARKNQQHILKVLQTLVKIHSSVKLLLVGDGEDEKILKEKIQKLGIKNHVEMLGFRKDIMELMSLADVAVSTSRQEGLPVNVMEAMAVGLPLIVTDCRGNRDLVKDGLNGYVVEQDNIERFSRKIDILLQNKPLRDKFSTYSTLFVQQYSDTKIQKAMKEIYTEFSSNSQTHVNTNQSIIPSKYKVN